MRKNETVLEKICRLTRDAYDSKTPIIFLNTDEIELANRVASCCNLVDLKLKSFPCQGRADFYYGKYIKSDETNLALCENFSTQFNSLKEFIEKYANTSPYDNRIESKLFLLHLVCEPGTTKANANVIHCLRTYINAYVSCVDDNSPLRTSCVILYGNSALLEEDLISYAEIITPDYPSTEEIKNLIVTINEKYGDKKYAPKEKDIQEIAYLMRGFTFIQAEFCIKKMIRLKQENGAPLMCNIKECKKLVLETKKQNLKHFGNLLELYSEDINNIDSNKKNTGNSIAGMQTFLDKADEIKKTFGENSDEFRLYHGTFPAKGCILVGPPGVGKSEAAKVLHRHLNLPMVKLNFGRLMGGLVGQSEKNLQNALKMFEAMSPCIAFIDEIDKNLSGAKSSSNEGGGTFQRMFGDLLEWLNNKTCPCYVIASANGISHLPDELFRNGRFDIRYGVFMPTSTEVRQIFAEQMKRAERNRKEEAAEKGMEISSQIFADDCFADKERTTVHADIMHLFIYESLEEEVKPKELNEIKFVSGADVVEIVKKALNTFDNKDLEDGKLIDSKAWRGALKKAIEDPTLQTQGSSEANLEKIAACYIRLLRKKLVPVNDVSLFPADGYIVKRDEQGKLEKAEYIDRSNDIADEYDKKLFEAIKDKINAMAFTIEEIEYHEECK